MNYPPGTDASTFARIPRRHREDAIQEAWVAHLEGDDPAKAASRYASTECRRERGRVPAELEQLTPDQIQKTW